MVYGKNSKDRLNEILGIARWLVDWPGDINAYGQNLIVLGYFNIDARGDILDKTFLSEGLYVPEDLQSVSRSIFNASKCYDRIAWFNFSGNVPNYRSNSLVHFVPIALNNRGLSKQELSFMISDRFSLWANFRI